MSLFAKAVKHDAKLRLAIAGPSGSGKTYSALAIATGLGGPIAFVDTEHGSASKYADLFAFDVLELHAPYHPDKYIDAIQSAAQGGYKVIVLDSMSHAWNGEGGLLELVEQATKRQKTPNSYTAWGDVTPIQNRLIEAIVSANIHIIATMRSKQEYVQEKDERTGRNVIRKVGMAPIQRDGFEYEFDIFLDMDTENNAAVSKTRCPELTGKVYAKPGAQVAKIIKAWLGGAPVESKPSRQVEPSTGEIEAAAANLPTIDDIIFERDEWTPPTDEEETIIHMWQSSDDAYAWAVNTGACRAIEHAKNSMKQVVAENNMRFTAQNKEAIFLATLRHWNERITQQQPHAETTRQAA